MLAIHTLLSSRIEVDFVDEWVDHHLSIGIDKIYIYNSGPRILYDTKPLWISDGNIKKAIRETRPHYLFDFRSDEEIERLFKSKLLKNTRVELSNLLTSDLPRNRKSYDDLQTNLNFSELQKYCNDGIEWIFNIDGDEFLNGDLKSLKKYNQQTSRIMLKQICHENRWSDDGRPRIIRDIPELSPDFISICNKNAVRPSDIIKWDNVHYGVAVKEGKKQEWSNDLFFRHYRGHGYEHVAKEI